VSDEHIGSAQADFGPTEETGTAVPFIRAAGDFASDCDARRKLLAEDAGLVLSASAGTAVVSGFSLRRSSAFLG